MIIELLFEILISVNLYIYCLEKETTIKRNIIIIMHGQKYF